MGSGIDFVARDRVHQTIAPDLTIRENVYINPLPPGPVAVAITLVLG